MDDVASAAAVVESQRVDIAILDSEAPGMGGGMVIKDLKSRGGDRFLPVMVLTTGDDGAAIERGMRDGADDFVPKPFSRTLISAKIRSAARARMWYEALRCQKNELVRAYHQLQFEHELAQRVFNSIIDNNGMEAPNLKCFLKPSSIANGDVVIWGIRPDGAQHVLLGDFTGHGLGAALGAIAVNDIFDAMTAKGFGLPEIGAEINRKLLNKLPTECFLAACMVELAVDVSTVRVWNAGVPPVAVLRSDGGAQWVASRYLPLGVSAGTCYDSPEVIRVAPGERVLMYTDGVVEAVGRDGEHFGERRLTRCIQSSFGDRSAIDVVRRELEAFQDNASQQDDITLVEMLCDGELLPQADRHAESSPLTGWGLSLYLDAAALREFDPLSLLDVILSTSPRLEGKRSELYTVIAELYTNALEHGVLGVPASLKDSEAGFEEYYRRYENGLASEHHGWVRVRVEELAGDRLRVTVEDSGAGISDLTKEVRHDGLRGRGLAVARALCQSIEIADSGSRVDAIFGG